MSKLNKEELLKVSREVFETKRMDLQSLFYDIPEKEFYERKKKLNTAEGQIKALIQKPEVTEEWIEEKMKKGINKSFKDYETEMQAILFIDPINKSSYRKINKATDALVDHIWDSIHSLVEEKK